MLLPDGRVILLPYTTNNIGLYDPSTNKFEAGPNVGSGHRKYANGGVLLPDGRVVLVPSHVPGNAETVGLYNPSYGAMPAYTLSQPLSPSWNAALLPYYNKY